MSELTLSMFEPRPLMTAEDKDEYLRLHNVYVPDRAMTMEEMERRDEAFPKDKRKVRELLWRGGKPEVGYVLQEAYWMAEPDCFMYFLLYDDIDVASADAAMALVEENARGFGAVKVTNWIYSTRESEIAAFEGRGYVRTQTNAQSELRLDQFDPEAFADIVRAFDDSGLRNLSLPEMAELYPDDWMRMYWEADWKLMADVPVPFELKQTPFEDWVKDWESERHNWPWTTCVLDGDEIVATTMLFRSMVDPGRFHTGLTSTLREYRRRGIAKAIKVKNLARAKAAGGRVVGTDNEGDNPMLQLNKQLGFKVVYHLYGFEKSL